MSADGETRCGFVAIVGRPNVGKSTLLNTILGQKVSITSSKRQTTRHRILGIRTVGSSQTVYVDTPGLHREGAGAMSRYLNRAATGAIQDVDVIVLVVDGLVWNQEDDYVLSRVRAVDVPVILAVNKVDKIKDKARLLPHIAALAEKVEFVHVIPLSAKTGENVAALEAMLARLLPISVFYFPEDQLTDRTERFLAAEFIREKLTRRLGQELPYALNVEVEEFKREGEVLHIGALILVERIGQKKIVIGKGGAVLKDVGKLARVDLEQALGCKVFLKLWVKVRQGWSDDERALQSLGYHD